MLHLANSQREAGHDVKIFTTKALDSIQASNFFGIPVKRFNYQYPYFGLTQTDKNRLDQSGGNLLSFPLLKALLREKNLSILHAHTTNRLGGIVRTAAKLKNIPYAVTLHGGMFNIPTAIEADRATRLERKLEWGKLPGAMLGSRRVLIDADVIFCLSNEELRSARRALPGARLEYLPNGVSCDQFRCGKGPEFRSKHRINPQSKLLLNVGRIDPQKNQLLLVKTMPHLLREHPDFHLVLIGHLTNDDYYRKIKRHVAALNLKKHVTVIPGLSPGDPELIDAYKAADIFCLPSIHEPFGIVILEAWAAGTPVVASAVGGILDFTVDEKDILLVDSTNPIHWRNQILRILNSPLKFSLVEQAERKARREYDWSVVNNRLMHVYEDLCR